MFNVSVERTPPPDPDPPPGPDLPLSKLPTSQLLMAIARDAREERLTLDMLATGLGDRTFGVLLLLLALPNCIPGPPGFGSIFGLPLLAVAVQMILVNGSARLPAILGRRTISRTWLLAILSRAMPILGRIERLCRPRMPRMVEGNGERAIGVVVLILALMICVPAPFTNAPPAIAILVLAVALLEKDGLIALLGLFGSIIALAVAAAGLIATIGLIILGARHFLG